MSQVHSTGAVVVLVATVAFLFYALWCAVREAAPAALGTARKVLAAVIGLQVLVGLILWATGDPPGESLHFLYAGVALLCVPGASAFASEAPPRAHAGVLAAAALLMLAMVWRLSATAS